MRAITCLCFVASLVAAAFIGPPDTIISPSFAQAPAAGDFVPGSRELFSADFSQAPAGGFTTTLKGLKYLRGTLQVADQDGMQVLQSTSPSEFLINLPEKLPDSFTLEFDLIPRGTDCCAGEELAFEGTPTINRSAGSANVLWHHQYLAILGGGKDMGNSTVKLPEDLQGELLGQLSEVRVSVSGTNFKLWTNGRLLYDLPNLPFVRGRVIRVFLGGTDVGDRAVSLARVRVAANGAAAGTAAIASGVSAVTVSTPVAMTPVNATATSSSAAPLSQTTLATATLTPPVAGMAGPTTTSCTGTTCQKALAIAGPPTITLAGFTGVGLFGRPAPNIELQGFAGVGLFGRPPPSIQLPGFAGTGEF